MHLKTESLITMVYWDRIQGKLVKKHYQKQDNGFYKCSDTMTVKQFFKNNDFSAINFTDSRSIYQFYNLKYLWEHIEFALSNNIKTLNIATEPIKTSEAYNYIFNRNFKNEVSVNPFTYNMKTKYFDNGYIFDKQSLINDIKGFVLKQFLFK